MNMSDFAAFAIALDRAVDSWTSTADRPHCTPPADIVKVADRLIYHSRRLRGMTDEAGIERIIRKVENLTGLEWDAITEGGITRLVGPIEIPD